MEVSLELGVGPGRAQHRPAMLALEVLVGILSGALLAASFPSYNLDWLAWIALAPLFVMIARSESGWGSLAGGYAAGIVFFAMSCPWIAATVHNYGGLNDAVAGIVFILFLLLMGSYLAVFAWAGNWLGRRIGHRLLPLPFLWIAIELLRTYTPMGGFPWNLLGYSQFQHPEFMRIAPFGGVYAASFLLALANTAVAALWLEWITAPKLRSRAVGAASATGLGLLALYAVWPYQPPPDAGLSLRARLVQPATPLNSDWSEASLEAFLRLQLIASTPAPGEPTQLIVWPEQPAPLDYASEPALQRMTAELLGETRSSVLLGEVSYARGANGAPDYDQPRNSALLIHSDGTTGQRYDKVHLVPFGEYVPLPHWFTQIAEVGKLVREVGDFVPGAKFTLFQLHGTETSPAARFATMICYESIFPEIARTETRLGAQFLVNQSDDSWYGRSSAAAQGLMMARVRALENRRWLLRDTNNGITAVVDPYGRVTASLPRFAASAIEAGFAPRTGLTFYTRHGDWLAYACTVIMGVLALWAAVRDSRPRRSLYAD